MQTQGMGSEGFCICLRCGYRQAHEAGTPCRSVNCPRCGAVLIREGSAHHQAYLQKHDEKEKPAAGQADDAGQPPGSKSGD
jgi:hypothetical protein